MTKRKFTAEKLAGENSAAKKRKFGLDIDKLDFNRTYSIKEFELIRDQINRYSNFELVNGKLVSIPYSSIAHEAIVHEVSRQLGNWNIHNSKNGVVTTSKGGFNFDVSGNQKIRAPGVAFIPANIYHSLDENQLWSFNGQPFTPVFVVEVADLINKGVEKEIDTKIKKEYFASGTSVELAWLFDLKERSIWVYKRNKNGVPYRRSKAWVDLEAGKTLPGFTLELGPIVDIISQVLYILLLLSRMFTLFKFLIFKFFAIFIFLLGRRK
jgi:Uma2 family endonuclease